MYRVLHFHFSIIFHVARILQVAEEFFPAFTWANFHLNQIKEKEQSKKGFFSAFVKAVIVCKESAQKLDSNLSVSLSETQVGEFTSMHLGRQLVQVCPIIFVWQSEISQSL